MPLKLIPELADRSGLKSYYVRAGKFPIGRIQQARMSGDTVSWQWSIDLSLRLDGVDMGGSVGAREDAMIAVRRSWQTWLAAVGAKEIDVES